MYLLSRIVFVAACAVLAGCRSRAPSLEASPLDIEVAGCAAIVGAADVCEVAEDAELRVWVAESSPGAIAIDIDAVSVAPVAVAAAEGGTRVTIALARGASSVRVRSGPREATVRIAPSRRDEAIDRARALRQRGDFAGARATLDAARPALDARDRARATGLRARLALAEGDPSRAAPLFRDAIRQDRHLEAWSDAIRDGCALTFSLTLHHHFTEARREIDGLSDLLPHDAEGRAAVPYYRALLASETGDIRGTLDEAAQSELLSRRLGLDAQERDARSLAALRLADAGRSREALRRLRELQERPNTALPPCDDGNLRIDIGWVEIFDPGADSLREARADLGRAVEIFDGPCKSARLLAYAEIDLALANLRLGLLDDAEAAVESARRAGPRLDAEVELQALEIEARLLLVRGAVAQAVEAFQRERAAAVAALSLESEWRALVGLGEAKARAGDTAGALAAYTAAEALLDEGIVRVPLSDDRSRFLGAHDVSARHLVSLLVTRGALAQAARAARHARARAITTLALRNRIALLGPAERGAWDAALEAYRTAHEQLAETAANDWEHSGATLARARDERRAREEELRTEFDRALARIEPPATARAAALPAPPADGVLELVYYPGDAGWLGFATDARTTVAARLDDEGVASALRIAGSSSPPRADLTRAAAALLDPFEYEVRAARTIRVLAYGPLAAVDVHALPFDGAPLLARADVVYPVDVGAEPRDEPDRPLSALVVVDPMGNLPRAREDGARVVDALHARGDVELLRGADAQLAAFALAAPRAEGLHFAGHAVYSEEDGVDSALLLAGGARWTAGDTLTLAHAPRWVFLSGCETARTSAEEIPATLGIAQSFVLAGSETVIASTRVVSDALASDLTSRTYARGGSGELSMASRVREAELAIARDGTGDWAAFRTITR